MLHVTPNKQFPCINYGKPTHTILIFSQTWERIALNVFLHLLTYEKTGLDKLLSGSPKVIQLECGGLGFEPRQREVPRQKQLYLRL